MERTHRSSDEAPRGPFAMIAISAGCFVLAACAPAGELARGPGSSVPAPSADAGTRPQPIEGDGAEPCNQLDDDGDGRVDETCDCSAGSSQPCWLGNAADRGGPGCRDGIQHCERVGEFLAWGRCEGYVACGSDCRSAETTCTDRRDEDCDGLTDCDDPDCAGSAGCGECVPEDPYYDDPLIPRCKDGIDNDCDGLTDCRDADCVVPGLREVDCGDGYDDDCDGLMDCLDPDCRFDRECGGAGCEAECVPGQSRWCDTPVDCAWGRQDCLPDGNWGGCMEVADRPGSCSNYYYDRACCVSAGACCQNFPTDESSVGACEAAVPTCE